MSKSPVDFSKTELLVLDVHVWGGKTKLYKDDLELVETELPPESLAHLGTINVVDPKDIAELNASSVQRSVPVCVGEAAFSVGSSRRGKSPPSWESSWPI